MRWIRFGNSSTNASRNRPWNRFGHPGPGAVVDVRLAADDLRDHRQRRRPPTQSVLATPMASRSRSKFGLPPPRVEQLDRLGAEQRLQAADQGEQDAGTSGRWRSPARGSPGRANAAAGSLEHLRHVHQEPRPDLVLGPVVRCRRSCPGTGRCAGAPGRTRAPARRRRPARSAGPAPASPTSLRTSGRPNRMTRLTTPDDRDLRVERRRRAPAGSASSIERPGPLLRRRARAPRRPAWR